MSDLIATGSAWLATQLAAHASKSVTYRRGVESVTVSATAGNTDMEVETSELRIERMRIRDYIITRSALVSLSGGADPRRGDQVDESIDGTTRRYEVMGPVGGPVFEDMDKHANLIRVHTKFVGVIA